MIENIKRKRLSKDERMRILNMFDGHCAYCGCKIEYNEMQIDHVIPLRRGGADTVENMLPACRSCNHYKSTLDLEDFRKMIEKMPDTLIRDSVTYKNAVRFGVVVPNKLPVIFYFENHPEPWEGAEAK
ncbi:HNH endonuclease [Eubacterium limosum]|uniref:HNH endonuclease n=1 Tax=Eubacterium limosum TaxID=1736 RepID=UPI001063DBFB|nr:HNH endonuclease signature motif containing protein [Eubacterium limosum]